MACLLALALSALCLMPTQARAATETHSGHCICGAEHRSVGGHKIDATTNNWRALTVDQNGHVTWPTEGNYYYLTGDVVIDETWQVLGSNSYIIICLNGHSITMAGSGDAIAVNGTGNNNTAKLTITDCKGTGKITHVSGALGRGVSVGQ